MIEETTTDAELDSSEEGEGSGVAKQEEAARKATNASIYFAGWYAEHGKVLNEERAKRYASDPEYKKKVLAQNRAARQKKRAETLERRKAAGTAERVEKAWKTRPLTLTLDQGQEVTVQGFTIGAVAKLLEVSVQAIRLWERKGHLPGTPFRYQGRDRLYPYDLIELYRYIVHDLQQRMSADKTHPKPLWMVRRIVQFAGEAAPREVKLFRIGVLAKAAKKTVVTLEQWESKNLLPITPFRAAGTPGYRLYTTGQIRSVVAAMRRLDWEIRGDEAKEAFHTEVLSAWKAQGVIGARILTLSPEPETLPEPTESTEPAD